jgi:hypothetical protein
MTRRLRLNVAFDVFKIALPATVAGAVPFAYIIGSPGESLGIRNVVGIVLVCATAALSGAFWGCLLAPALVSIERAKAVTSGIALPLLALYTWLTATVMVNAAWNREYEEVLEAARTGVFFSAYGILFTGWFLVPLGIVGALLIRRKYLDEPVLPAVGGSVAKARSSERQKH